MKPLDRKINDHFPGKVVRKDLTKLVKGNAIVPTYVLEYLLGQYCATDDENTIKDLDDLMDDIEYVVEGLRFQTAAREACITDSRVVSLSSDEGFFSPYGICDIVAEISFQTIEGV